jgi:hypothetical protein
MGDWNSARSHIKEEWRLDFRQLHYGGSGYFGTVHVPYAPCKFTNIEYASIVLTSPNMKQIVAKEIPRLGSKSSKEKHRICLKCVSILVVVVVLESQPLQGAYHHSYTRSRAVSHSESGSRLLQLQILYSKGIPGKN